MIWRAQDGTPVGFLESIFALIEVDLPVPDHSTLSRRLGKLNIEIPVLTARKAIHLVVDKGMGESV
ncbi:transposase [Okeania sp. SIO2B3]|uniref:transposase n=1 Tax=Okeania sp. SIO2B3 TaxID=2607784 RepID=UPI0013C009BE|nr:transposase [Okeania sp. SIO2B3]NET46124.1 hypothetical protein [Okeania sp. SIO2B3]